MADNFEQLGFQVKVDGADSAVSNLDRIEERFEKLDDITLRLKKSQISLDNATITYQKSLVSLSSATGNYEKRQNALAKAKHTLTLAEQEYNKLLSRTYYSNEQAQRAEFKLLDARMAVQNAEISLYQAEERVNSARATSEQRANALQKAEISHALAIRTANEERNREKSILSEEEKYLQRVNQEKDLLNSKTYEEARRIELANQQRKKEIDQRLKQELGIKQTTKSLTAYLAKLSSGVMVARRLGRFVSGAIQESAAYTENLVLFSTAFGKSTEEQLKWALGLADAYGLARNEVVKFAGTFRELASSLGIVGETADNVTRIVTNLGYDLSALYNTSVEKAMEKLQSGVFTGQTKPLRYFGVDISQESINRLFETNEALAGLGVNARNLSQSDKVLARLLITINGARNSFGTMATEINNLQSQFRIFQGSLSNFKLAIGNLVQEPLKNVMININGFIIALTNIINAFSPKREEEKTIFDNTTQGAEEASEAIDTLNGKLAGFDKFNVLGQGGDSSSNLAVTEQLNKLLAEQARLYEEEVAKAMEEVKNQAVQVSKSIRDWFVKVDEKGKFVDWTNNAKLLGIALNEIGLIIAYVFGKKMITSMVGFFTKYITNIQELRLQNALATTTFQKLQVALNAVISGVLSLTMGIAALVMNWDNMSDASKFITIFVSLAAAIGSAAAALYLFKQNYAMAIGVGATVLGTGLTIGSQLGSMTKHADGGYTNANLIMTHENGKREWVGKAAGSSAIVNDTQMSDIMEVAVAKGVYNALSARSAMGGNVPTNETIVVKIGEEAVFNAVRKTARRQGRDFANV